MLGPFKGGDTIVTRQCGVVLVEKVMPSGAMVVRDCLGYVWLLGKDCFQAEMIPDTLQESFRPGEEPREKRMGHGRKMRRKR